MFEGPLAHCFKPFSLQVAYLHIRHTEGMHLYVSSSSSASSGISRPQQMQHGAYNRMHKTASQYYPHSRNP